MAGKFMSVFFAVATLVTVLIFLVEMKLTPPAQEVLAETEPEPAAQTTAPPETLPDPRLLSCEEVGRKISAGHVFVYDTASREMLYCSTDSTIVIIDFS